MENMVINSDNMVINIVIIWWQYSDNIVINNDNMVITLW